MFWVFFCMSMKKDISPKHWILAVGNLLYYLYTKNRIQIPFLSCLRAHAFDSHVCVRARAPPRDFGYFFMEKFRKKCVFFYGKPKNPAKNTFHSSTFHHIWSWENTTNQLKSTSLVQRRFHLRWNLLGTPLKSQIKGNAWVRSVTCSKIMKFHCSLKSFAVKVTKSHQSERDTVRQRWTP